MNVALTSVQKKQFIGISLMYFLGAFSMLIYFGVNSGGEAFKYLLDAKSIAEGRNLNYGEFSYFFIGYSLLLSFFIKFKISLVVVSVLQILLAYGAAFFLYKLIKEKTSNNFLALLIFVCYLFCYPIQKWIFFIYSEGVHTSLGVIGFFFFIKLTDKFNAKNLFYFTGLSLAIITTRPVGILFLLAAYFTFIFVYFSKKQYKTFFSLLVVGIILCIAALNSPFRYFVNPDSLKRMEVICMVPQEGIKADYSQFNRTGLMGAYKVIKNEIGVSRFFKAGLHKMILFFGFVRPYFSLKNNIFLAINWLFYPFALIGIFFNKRKEYSLIKFFSIAIILITATGIFVTCDDWGNRFIAPIFPFVIILAVIGVCYLQTMFKNKYPKITNH